MRKKRWFLIFDDARIDVALIIEKGKITGFSLNLSTLENDKKHDVIRWDTAHGYLHKHEFWRTMKAVKEKRYEEVPLDLVFREVYDDLRKNWYVYVEKFRRKGDKVE